MLTAIRTKENFSFSGTDSWLPLAARSGSTVVIDINIFGTLEPSLIPLRTGGAFNLNHHHEP